MIRKFYDFWDKHERKATYLDPSREIGWLFCDQGLQRVIWWRKFLQRTFLEGLSALNRKRWDKQKGGGLTWMCQLRFSGSTPWVQFSFKVNGVLTEEACVRVCACVCSWSWLLQTKSLRYQRRSGREGPWHGPWQRNSEWGQVCPEVDLNRNRTFLVRLS